VHARGRAFSEEKREALPQRKCAKLEARSQTCAKYSYFTSADALPIFVSVNRYKCFESHLPKKSRR